MNLKQVTLLGILVTILFYTFVFTAFGEVNMDIIMQIESGGNSQAHNKNEDGRGLFQINPICLKDFNQYHVQQYIPQDLWQPTINREVAEWYMFIRIPQMLRYYKKEVTVENQIIAWNAGISYVIYSGHLPITTKKYLQKYRRLAK